ncbi:MAG: rhodanese-like domain-containing protein [bacterium]
MTKNISVIELKEIIDSNGIEKLTIIDCREVDEFGYCHIDGTTNIPISEFEDRALKEISKEDTVYLLCHVGGRSARACLFLKERGYTKLVNIAGGLEAWALEIDQKFKRY